MTREVKAPPLHWLDLRICLAFMVLTSVVSLMLSTETALLTLFALECLWLLLFGLKRQVISYLVWYFALWGGLYVLRDIPVLGSTSLPLVIVYARRIMLPVMAARPLLASGSGRLVASMNRMGLPRAATLSLAILFRFMPTIAQEYAHIRDAQKFRGIGDSFWSVVRHPLRTMECTLIPMLIRTSKTADELSASAAVRGMKLEGESSSWHKVAIGAADWSVLIPMVLLPVAILLLDHGAKGVTG